MRSVTASNLSSLIRLAASLPEGSPERRSILSGITKVTSTSKKAEIHDGKHAHIFGYDSMPKTIAIAKKFKGKVKDTGVGFDSEGDPQDWADLSFPSEDDAQAFVEAVDWRRADARLHHKDTKIFGAGLSRW